MKNIVITLLIAASIAVAASVNYSYDAAGRLVGIDYGAGGSITYTYDAAGNITSRTVQPGSAAPSVIASARLSADGNRIELIGTNLAPAEGVDVVVTVNAEPVRILSTCNSSTPGSGCRQDRLTLQVTPGAKGRLEIRVKNGAHPESVWRSAK